MFLCFLKQQSLGCWCLSRISALLRAGVQATHVYHSKVEQEMLPAPVQPLGTVSEPVLRRLPGWWHVPLLAVSTVTG